MSDHHPRALDDFTQADRQQFTMSTGANIRQNYHEETEGVMNALIKMQLTSSYSYLAMAAHYDRDDVALKGFHQFFLDMSKKKRECAESLQKKQNERGGRIIFEDLKAPAKSNWGSGADGLTAALTAEKETNDQFIKFHGLCDTHGDKHMMDWVESEFLEPHVECIKKLGDMRQQLARAGKGLGEYMYDKELE